MPLKAITSDAKILEIHSPCDFERIFHIRYTDKLEFNDPKIRQIVEKKSVKALAKGWITQQQKWLGAYYTASGKIALDLTIAWIDPLVGYGVWTNREIPAKTFIGQYAGLVRKRKFWKRWENLYCFDYTIGFGRSTPLVIDSQDCGDHVRFINHSYAPNLDLTSIYCDGLMHVILTAKRAIDAGEQLCYDYGDEYWKKRGKPIALAAQL